MFIQTIEMPIALLKDVFVAVFAKLVDFLVFDHLF